MINLFGNDAPNQATGMVREKRALGETESQEFWVKLEMRIREILDDEEKPSGQTDLLLTSTEQ